ncbi:MULTISPECIES: polymorphic toxin type 5 domain-containing protein [Streptomyces]|uniref:polymorphic toxin type 5 domain-containing protein n=1 Tax=Streptomyces TaxID=1883 RepID=UPI00384CD74E
MNWMTGAAEAAGAVANKSAVLIDNYPVDIPTARLWEAHGALPKGTVSAAPVVEPPPLCGSGRHPPRRSGDFRAARRVVGSCLRTRTGSRSTHTGRRRPRREGVTKVSTGRSGRQGGRSAGPSALRPGRSMHQICRILGAGMAAFVLGAGLLAGSAGTAQAAPSDCTGGANAFTESPTASAASPWRERWR